MTLTKINVTPLHLAFDEVRRTAGKRGVRATGVLERELVRIAVRSMGLDDLPPFNPEERVIEYPLRSPDYTRLVSMWLADSTAETASGSPTTSWREAPQSRPWRNGWKLTS